MRIKVIYRKNLKLSEGKLAAQVAHAVKNLGETPKNCNIVVLKASDKKFKELAEEHNAYIQVDKGLTEVEGGTETAAAWIEDYFEAQIDEWYDSDTNLNVFEYLGITEEEYARYIANPKFK